MADKIVNHFPLVDGSVARYEYKGLISDVVNPDLFGVGNIGISSSGWVYNEVNDQMRVRTLPDVTIPLSAGDKIYLTDYTNAKFYVGFRSGTTYTSQGWITSGAYTASADGEAVILIAYKTNPSPIVNIKDALLSLLRIDSFTGGNVSIEDVENDVSKIDATLKAIDFSNFEIGNLYFGSSTASPYDNWSWEYNTRRIRTRKNHPIHLNAGDYVYVTDTSKIQFYIGCVKDSDGTAWNSGYWSTHYPARYSGDYYFIVRFSPESTITNPYDVLKYFRISTSDASAYVDVNVAIGKALDENNLVSKNKLGKSFIATFGGYQSSGLTPYGVPSIDTAQKKMIIPPDFLLLFDGTGASTNFHTTGVNPVEVDYSTLATSAVAIYFDNNTKQFVAKRFDATQNENEYLFATIRTDASGHPNNVCMSSPYTIDGKLYGIDTTATVDIDTIAWAFNENVKGVNHRGFYTAPENTLPAYKLSKKQGFKYCECDVSMTSDRVPVLLHDDTINRTARNADGTEISGTISIGSITYEQALQYDFGIYKGSQYAGTKIPTFEQFITLCRNLGLHPYIELKSAGGYSEAEVQSLVDIVRQNGMDGKVSWISFSSSLLAYVKNYDASARLGFIVGALTSANITTASSLKTTTNEVFLDVSSIADDLVDDCITAGLPVEVWTVNTESGITALNDYVSGVTSDNLIAAKVLYEANI